MNRLPALQPMLTYICSMLLISGAAAVYAARAHVHGEGELSIAVEDGQVDLSLLAPAADLRSDEDEGEAAMQARFSSENLFAFQDASCQLVSSAVMLADEEVSWLESDEHDSDEHEQQEKHADHDAHAAEDHSSHSDYLLTWTYKCSNDPDRISVELFGQTDLNLIRVQALGETGAITAELTVEDSSVELP